jgi:sialate O-acetylesterase
MEMEYCGPLLKRAYRNEDRIIIEFSHAEGGLVVSESGAGLFEIAGDDGNFIIADAKMSGNQIIIKSDEVRYPVSGRYAWDVFYKVGLFNKSMLPASPFTFDLIDGIYSLNTTWK